MPSSHSPRLATRLSHATPFLAALLSAGLIHAPALAAQHRATLHWAPGNSSSNGFESASIDVQYSFQSCDGELWISMGGMRQTLQTSDAYWYKGSRYPVPASARPDWSSIHVDFGGEVIQQTPQGPRHVATFSYNTGPSYSGGCFSAINFTALGKMATLFAPKLTNDERSAILGSLSVNARDLSRQLTSQSVEWAIDTRIRDSVYAVKQAERERLRLARNDSISKARAAEQAAVAARRDSARARGTASSTRPAATTAASGASGASTRPSSTGRSSSTTTPAQTQAERQAAAQARADSVQRMLEEQQAQNEARDRATTEAVTTAVTTTAALAQAMGSMMGGYYFTAEEPPANSSYMVQTMSGIGGGLSGRWMYVDAGMVTATLTDNYIAKAKARTGYAPDKDQSGYFMSGGLSLEMPFDGESSFGFAPSLGYTYIVTTEEVPAGGVHAGFGVRLGSFKVRVDMGSGEYGSTYGIGGYIRF